MTNMDRKPKGASSMMIEVTTVGMPVEHRHKDVDVVRVDAGGHLKLEHGDQIVAVYAQGKWVRAVRRDEV